MLRRIMLSPPSLPSLSYYVRLFSFLRRPIHCSHLLLVEFADLSSSRPVRCNKCKDKTDVTPRCRCGHAAQNSKCANCSDALFDVHDFWGNYEYAPPRTEAQAEAEATAQVLAAADAAEDAAVQARTNAPPRKKKQKAEVKAPVPCAVDMDVAREPGQHLTGAVESCAIGAISEQWTFHPSLDQAAKALSPPFASQKDVKNVRSAIRRGISHGQNATCFVDGKWVGLAFRAFPQR